ncbi:MAG TPA: type IV secretion system protein [Candidatus Eisenbacteria bacterium]|nr:type IV secretion system protein [Candidatus Eisenbacteria bacterium]
MKLSARIVSCAVVLLFLFSLFIKSNAYAQTPGSLPNSFMRTDGSVPLNVSTLTQGVFLGILSSATCIVGGIDYLSPNHHCLGYNTKTATFSYAQDTTGGLLGLGLTGISFTYTSPFHSTDYLQYLSQNFGLAKHTYAANGIGFNQLSPIMSLWIAFRNLTYLLFVVAFVVIGFAIMLRAKIDPRTVMTVENQIPKLVVALILITFSFAIAGLMIDIMWVAIYLIINLFGNLDPVIRNQIGSMTSAVKSDPFSWTNTLNNGFGGFLGIAAQAAGGVKDIASVVFFNIFQNAGPLKILIVSTLGIPILISCTAGVFASGLVDFAKTIPVVGGIMQFTQFFGSALTGAGQSTTQNGFQNLGACLDAGFATFFGTIIGAVTFLIFAVALLVAIAKLWWQLIKAYTLFLIFTIFGPVMIMLGIVPGSKTNFEYWLRHIAAYLICFPTAIGVFLVGKTLMDMYSTSAATVAPPLIGVDPKVFTFMGPLLGFAVIMLAPQSLSMVQDALGAPDPKFLAGIGQSIGVGSAAVGGGVSKLWDRSFRESDPLRGLDEGWLRKFLLPRNSRRREIFIGKETGTGLKPDSNG